VREDFQLADNPDVYVISNIVENGKPLGNPNDGFAWHTDLSFLERPTAFTFLYALEVPAEGGDTQFASAATAYDLLDDTEKARLEAISVRHSYRMLHATRKNVRPLTEDELRRMPDVVHPLVRTHPATRRKALYLGPNTSLPVGMEPEEGANLISRLMEWTVQPERVYSHRWRPGDLVVWDNHTVVHRATDYDRQRYRRLMHRVTVRGERPI
jgi:taurine dioxygenase